MHMLIDEGYMHDLFFFFLVLINCGEKSMRIKLHARSLYVAQPKIRSQ
jgi:hypothetical protein